MPVIDSYSHTNQDASYAMNAAGMQIGQSFTGDGSSLEKASFYLGKSGSPTGQVTAKLYAHSGTFGSGGVPTGAALATSNAIQHSAIGASLAWHEFTFPTPYSLGNGTKYFIAVETSQGSFDRITMGYDGSSPTHAGNSAIWNGSWSAQTTDVIFSVEGSASSASRPRFLGMNQAVRRGSFY